MRAISTHRARETSRKLVKERGGGLRAPWVAAALLLLLAATMGVATFAYAGGFEEDTRPDPARGTGLRQIHVHERDEWLASRVDHEAFVVPGDAEGFVLRVALSPRFGVAAVTLSAPDGTKAYHASTSGGVAVAEERAFRGAGAWTLTYEYARYLGHVTVRVQEGVPDASAGAASPAPADAAAAEAERPPPAPVGAAPPRPARLGAP